DAIARQRTSARGITEVKRLASPTSKTFFNGLLLWVGLLCAGSGAQESPVLATASFSVPVIRALQPDGCLQPGGLLQIIGEAFGTRKRPVQLVSASVRLPVEVLSWSDTRIEARLPVAGRLSASHF